jgi:hypothetical protein
VLQDAVDDQQLRGSDSCNKKRFVAQLPDGVRQLRMSGKNGQSLSSAIRWLARFVHPLASLVIADLVCMIVGSGLSLLDPLVVKWLIDVALPKRDLHLVLLSTLLFCTVYLASLGPTTWLPF